jgi:hypothetical protein
VEVRKIFQIDCGRFGKIFQKLTVEDFGESSKLNVEDLKKNVHEF